MNLLVVLFMTSSMNCQSILSCVMHWILLLETYYELFLLYILFLMHAHVYEYKFLYTHNS